MKRFKTILMLGTSRLAYAGSPEPRPEETEVNPLTAPVLERVK